jgi:hypothetical protein
MKPIYIHDRADGNWYQLRNPERVEADYNKATFRMPLLDSLCAKVSSVVGAVGGFLGGCYLFDKAEADTMERGRIPDAMGGLVLILIGSGSLIASAVQIGSSVSRYFGRKELAKNIEALAKQARKQNFDRFFVRIFPPARGDGIRVEIHSREGQPMPRGGDDPQQEGYHQVVEMPEA